MIVHSCERAPKCTYVGYRQWAVDREFLCTYEKDSEIKYITVPSSFQTDGMSVPAPLRIMFFKRTRKPHSPSIVHDYCYRTREVPRKEADMLFRELLKWDGMDVIRRNAAYYAVRAFGAKFYN